MRIALAPGTKAEIFAADQSCCAEFIHQPTKKVLPGAAHQRPVKGKADNPIHMESLAQEQIPIRHGIDQPWGSAQNQGIRVVLESHHTAAAAQFLCQIPAGIQQGGVAPMHAIEESQSKNGSLVHNFS